MPYHVGSAPPKTSAWLRPCKLVKYIKDHVLLKWLPLIFVIGAGAVKILLHHTLELVLFLEGSFLITFLIGITLGKIGISWIRITLSFIFTIGFTTSVQMLLGPEGVLVVFATALVGNMQIPISLAYITLSASGIRSLKSDYRGTEPGADPKGGLQPPLLLVHQWKYGEGEGE